MLSAPLVMINVFSLPMSPSVWCSFLCNNIIIISYTVFICNKTFFTNVYAVVILVNIPFVPLLMFDRGLRKNESGP